MGTINEKLSYLSKTKTFFKDNLNSLGAEITNSTAFRNYLNWLDTFYGEVSDKTDLNVNGIIGKTNQNTVILPSEYTQVDYIESNGTQYVDTGINADINLDINIDMQYTNTNPVNNNTNFGAIYKNGSSYNRYHINKLSSYINIFALNNTGKPTVEYDTNRHNIYIKTKERKTIIDNTEYELPENNYNDTNLNFWLFGRNSNDNSLKFYNETKLYFCKMYYNNELVRDFIPCYRNSDDEVGLYDLVNNVFYANQGTDAFTYGAVVNIPNPDYPQPINNLSGNVNYKIEGKNIFNVIDLTTITITNNGRATHTTTSDKIIITTNSGSYNSGVFIRPIVNYIDNYDNNREYIVSFDIKASQTLSFKYGLTSFILTEIGNDITRLSVKQQLNATGGFVFYSTQNRAGDTIEISNIMISESEDTTYEGYTGIRTFNIPLGDIELCKIDTYEDKIYSSNGRFYLNKSIGKVVLNGGETWKKTNTQYPGLFSASTTLSTMKRQNIFSGDIYTNYFKENEFATQEEGITKSSSPLSYDIIIIRIFKNRASDMEGFTTWLSTHNTIVYYLLNTPTTTEITQENYPSLYNALKQIQDYLTNYKINKEFILNYDELNINY